MRRRVLICLSLALGCAHAATARLDVDAAPAGESQLRFEQAVRDTKTMLALLEETHPDPYTRFGGKVAFKRRAQALIASLPAGGLSPAELADRLNAFLSLLHDGHTYIAGVTDRWSDPDPRLPVQFGIAADGLFIAGFHVPELAGTLGWRVLGANHVALAELLARFNASPRENVYGGYRQAASFLRSLVSMDRLVDGQRADEAIVFSLESPDGRREDRVVPWSTRTAVPEAEWRQAVPRWGSSPPSDEMFCARIIGEPAVGYLRVGALMGREAFEFAYHMNPANARRQAERFYQSRGQQAPADLERAIPAMPSLFETAVDLLTRMKERRIATLLVDLRGNTGGWTSSAYPMLHALYGDAFYASSWPGEYVRVESPLFLKKAGTTVEDRKKSDPAFEPGQYVFPREPGIPDGPRVRDERLREYRTAGYSFAAALSALGGEPVYRPAHLVVLCDHGTFSAAFHLLMWLRQMGGVIVGIPSQQSPNAFMDTTDFTLSESGLRGSISNAVQFMLPDAPQQDVLQPDFPVTLAVFRRYGYDQEAPLRYALELVASGTVAKAARHR